MVCATTAVRDVRWMITNKVVLLIDDMWLEELVSKMVDHVQNDEILQILDKTEVEVCDACGIYDFDGEVVMDVFRCDSQKEYCLNCCGCDEHAGEAWY